MSGNEEELEELREQTQVSSRLQAGAGESEESTLEDAIATAFGAVDDGELSKTLSVRDDRLAALVHGLEADGSLDRVGAELQEALGRDVDEDSIDRSEALRLALRLGFQEASPDILETAKDAHARHMSDRF